MAGGRPREVDYILQAKLLDEWSQKDDSISLYGFTDDKPYLAQQLSDFAQLSPEFALALRKAKERIARRREQKACEGTMHAAIWGRTVRCYDSALRAEEEATKDAEAERRMKIAKVEAVSKEDALADLMDRVDPKNRNTK